MLLPSGKPVNLYKKLWKITMLLMGKLTIFVAICKLQTVSHYQRVTSNMVINLGQIGIEWDEIRELLMGLS